MTNNYDKLIFKIPVESEDYTECSDFVVISIEEITQAAMDEGRNKIIISTNLRLGLPMENINKIAGPFIEAWAFEIFSDVLEDENNEYHLINVEAGERLSMADIILQFRRERKRQSSVTANVDVKATSKDIKNSGRSPNITSFARIRTAYIEDPDYIFVILSIKHKVYSRREPDTKMMTGVMEVVDFNAYDLKYISDSDISYNPALGTGQLQVRDIHYVTRQERTIWEFSQMLDKKCMASGKGFEGWYHYAKKHEWIKNE
ncbi:MAG: restriction endonuclease [Desulfobacteraceae bacterium 4572_88]|nr:MAG: restriction endonuclease [Desulfobacteraceae bacterium 4572_88]